MLCIKSVANENEVYPLKGFKFSIGSAPECDIVLEHGMLHDIHALLWVGKDFVTVMTVQDAVVTVNGELVTDRRKVQIGETIAFADQEMRVDEISEEAPKKTAKAKKPEKTEESESEWMLISRNPEMKGQKIKIEERCTVGRAKDNTICIPMISLSRHHATLNLDEEGLTVKDEQSANGTFINGKQIGAEPTRLQRGDIVAFDELEFLVHGPESSIYSEQTSVRAVARPNFASRSPVPTAIDRQKISIVQRKPESFTEKFEAIQAEQSFGNRAGKFLSSPVFWLGIVAVIIIAAAVTTASAQDFSL